MQPVMTLTDSITPLQNMIFIRSMFSSSAAAMLMLVLKFAKTLCVKIIKIKHKKEARILNNLYIMNA